MCTILYTSDTTIPLGGVQLGSSKEIVIAWWGNYHHSLCTISDDVNTIVVHSEEGDTMICSQCTTWIEYILNLCERPIVADMFSTYGMYEIYSLLQTSVCSTYLCRRSHAILFEARNRMYLCATEQDWCKKNSTNSGY